MDVFKRPFLVRCERIAACCRTDYSTDASMVPRGFGVPPSHHAPSVIAVPVSQHSQHYGERAITQLDYDGSQAARSENFPRSLRHSLSRSRTRHRPGSRHSSKAPDIIIHRMWYISYPSGVFLLLSQRRLLQIWASTSDRVLQTLFQSRLPTTRAVTVTTGPVTVIQNGIVPVVVIMTVAMIVSTTER